MGNDTNPIPPGMTRAQYLNSLDPRSPTFADDFQKVLNDYQKEMDSIIPDTIAATTHNGNDQGVVSAGGGNYSPDVSAYESTRANEMNQMMADVNALVAADQVREAVSNLQSNGPGCCCPGEPNPSDSGQPDGSMTVDKSGVITTPGGYKIEATAQYEWKITGPDGKSTRVWGDPHVEESDGGKWDFKRDSTFVLGDGTRINVNTKPYNNMTVTDKLEVIAGNQRVEVNGVADGKGKVGEITNDGYAHVNSFGNKDAFVMGKETDDWSFQGKEVVGSNDGGNSFKLGNDLPAGVVKPVVDHANSQGADFFTKIYESLANIAKSLESQLTTPNKQYTPPENQTDFQKLLDPANRGCWNPNGTRNGDALKALGNLFSAVGKMFEALSELVNLSNQVRRPPVQMA